MPNLAKGLLLLVTSLFAGAAALPADAPPAKPLKAGWNRKQIKAFAYVCSDALMQPTVRDYDAAAKKSGAKNPPPFPEKRFTDSAFPMCLCISQRVAENFDLKELNGKDGIKKAQPYIEEALRGGICKPQGMLGEILDEKARRP